jgi:predicted ATPase
VNVPAFLFAEFDSPLDGSGPQDAPAQQLLYALREPFERVLLSNGCQWLKPQGRRLLSVLENEKVLFALSEIMQVFSAKYPVENPIPFRVVVHCGTAFRGSSGWFGPEIDHTMRLLDAVDPGFPILSESAGSLPMPKGYHRMSLGMHLLKDLRPSEELFALHSDQLSRMDFAIPKSMGAYRHNLPAQTTPFMGRNDSLKDLSDLLAERDTRMITLLGPGGFGKTRLALQVAANLVDRYEGVYWVPLAPLTSEDRLTVALSDSLGLVFYKGEDPFQKVLESLQGRRTLLMFDNFEHLTGGRDYVKRILESTPAQIVVTSREALRIPQEKVVEISGLKYPERADDPMFEEFGASQLFITGLARAGRTEPLDVSEKAAFVDLCKQLHGMPLGIEMSASLAINHPLSEIVRQLRERIDYLAVSLPHLPDRQKSTRAVFEYSWNLLDEGLRKTLGRLSIIRGAFDDEVARQVARCDQDEIQQLQDRSLVVALTDGRKELHETVRYYAKEHLYEDSVDRKRTLEACAKFYLTFMRDSLARFEGRDQRKYLEAAAERHENVQSAFLWAVENAKWDWAAETLEAYALFFDRLAKFQEGHAFFGRLLKNMDEATDVPKKDASAALFRANLLSWRASLGVRMGLAEGSEADLEECLMIFKGKASDRRRAQTLLVLGQVLEARGKKAESIDRLSHSLAQFEACKDLNGAAYARNRLGQGLLQWGQISPAATLIREALTHYEKSDNPSGMAWSHMLLGQAAMQESKFDEAKDHYREGLEGYLTVGNRDGVGWAMIMMGQVAKYRGDYAGAGQMFLEALTIANEISNHAAQAWTHLNLAETEWVLGRPENAELHANQCLEIYERLGDRTGLAAALQRKAHLALWRGDSNEAERLFLEAEGEIKTTTDPLVQAWHLYHMGRVAQQRGNSKEAETFVLDALERFKKVRQRFGLGWSYHLAAELALHAGKIPPAKEFLRESLALAKELRLPPILLEDWLVWAGILAEQKRYVEAVEWAEAVVQKSNGAKPLWKRAASLRDEWEMKLDAEERVFARRVATTADLDIWTNRILEKEPEPVEKSKRKTVRKSSRKK